MFRTCATYCFLLPWLHLCASIGENNAMIVGSVDASCTDQAAGLSGPQSHAVPGTSAALLQTSSRRISKIIQDGHENRTSAQTHASSPVHATSLLDATPLPVADAHYSNDSEQGLGFDAQTVQRASVRADSGTVATVQRENTSDDSGARTTAVEHENRSEDASNSGTVATVQRENTSDDSGARTTAAEHENRSEDASGIESLRARPEQHQATRAAKVTPSSSLSKNGVVATRVMTYLKEAVAPFAQKTAAPTLGSGVVVITVLTCCAGMIVIGMMSSFQLEDTKRTQTLWPVRRPTNSEQIVLPGNPS